MCQRRGGLHSRPRPCFDAEWWRDDEFEPDEASQELGDASYRASSLTPRKR